MGVEPKIGGKPPKWMVKIRENPINMDDLGIPLFLETPIVGGFNPFEKYARQIWIISSRIGVKIKNV